MSAIRKNDLNNTTRYRQPVDVFTPEGKNRFMKAADKLERELLSDKEKAIAFLDSVKSRYEGD